MTVRTKYFIKTALQSAVIGTIAWALFFGFNDPVPYWLDIPYYIVVVTGAILGLDWVRGYIPPKQPK